MNMSLNEFKCYFDETDLSFYLDNICVFIFVLSLSNLDLLGDQYLVFKVHSRMKKDLTITVNQAKISWNKLFAQT